jgi:hypothetical protein
MASIFFTERLPGISKAKGQLGRHIQPGSLVSDPKRLPKSRLYAKSLTGQISKRCQAFNADFSGFWREMGRIAKPAK